MTCWMAAILPEAFAATACSARDGSSAAPTTTSAPQRMSAVAILVTAIASFLPGFSLLGYRQTGDRRRSAGPPPVRHTSRLPTGRTSRIAECVRGSASEEDLPWRAPLAVPVFQWVPRVG